jgi:bifunctional DNase/RNase
MRNILGGTLVGLAAAVALLCSPAGAAAAAAGATEKLYEMEVMGVQADPRSGAPLVFLRGREDKRELTMFIGPFEAQGIILPLQGRRPPRPYTHDLLLEVIHRLQAKVKRVVITEVRDNTYFARLILEARGQEVTLDSRPSDAIAVALRAEAPILAAEAAFVRTAPPGPATPGEQEAP